MGYFLTEEEREALWGEEPRAPTRWESPDVRAARLQTRVDELERALRGMLALATTDTGALMLQAVAADVIGDTATREAVLRQLAARRTP